ncbi:MAG: NAD(P)H-dependent oxidoreductase [Candidatus Adlerbacteria bacterium]
MFNERLQKKIVLLVGHPDTGQTHTRELAVLYEAAAKKAGHEVQKFHVGEMHFDPILYKGYKVIQPLEPDLQKLQDAIRQCDHFVVLYPNWWCTMPALLKGLFDRIWLPGFAFTMRKNKQGVRTVGWDKLLKGKTARVIVLSGTHPLLVRLFFGNYTNELARGVLWFAGFNVRTTCFGPSEHAPEWKLNSWRRQVIRLGRLGE